MAQLRVAVWFHPAGLVSRRGDGTQFFGEWLFESYYRRLGPSVRLSKLSPQYTGELVRA